MPLKEAPYFIDPDTNQRLLANKIYPHENSMWWKGKQHPVFWVPNNSFYGVMRITSFKEGIFLLVDTVTNIGYFTHPNEIMRMIDNGLIIGNEVSAEWEVMKKSSYSLKLII